MHADTAGQDRALSIEETIRSVYQALSASDRKLADVIVGNRAAVATYSATELAGMAGVSKASAARFFRRLGYEDFNSFRADARAEASGESPLLKLERLTRAGTGTAAGSSRHAFTNHVETDARNLMATLAGVRPVELGRALTLLRGARRVWVVGYRNGFATAFYAHALFSHALRGVTLLNDGAASIADTLSEIEKGDVLFAVDFRRRTRLLPRVVDAAREAGAGVVLLTYTPLSDVASKSQAVLACATESPSIFDSYVAAMSLVNFLATQLVAGAPADSRRRMERMERIHGLLDDLDGTN